jgi:hypothetical protein
VWRWKWWCMVAVVVVVVVEVAVAVLELNLRPIGSRRFWVRTVVSRDEIKRNKTISPFATLKIFLYVLEIQNSKLHDFVGIEGLKPIARIPSVRVV